MVQYALIILPVSVGLLEEAKETQRAWHPAKVAGYPTPPGDIARWSMEVGWVKIFATEVYLRVGAQ